MQDWMKIENTYKIIRIHIRELNKTHISQKREKAIKAVCTNEKFKSKVKITKKNILH